MKEKEVFLFELSQAIKCIIGNIVFPTSTPQEFLLRQHGIDFIFILLLHCMELEMAKIAPPPPPIALLETQAKKIPKNIFFSC